MSEMLVAEIRPEWAEILPEKYSHIWSWNRFNAEEIGRSINLRLLGGLVVPVDDRIVTPAQVEKIAGMHSVVNLAFSEPALMTETAQLLRASIAQTGEESLISEQLRARSSPSVEHNHGGNEYWTLPLSGVVVSAVPAAELATA